MSRHWRSAQERSFERCAAHDSRYAKIRESWVTPPPPRGYDTWEEANKAYEEFKTSGKCMFKK